MGTSVPCLGPGYLPVVPGTPHTVDRPGPTARRELDMDNETDTPDAGLVTVVLALGANALVATAKTVAAVLTGSASMVAESAHSCADTGNEVFLLLAERRGSRPADPGHPGGHGRETYVWTMFAAVGLLVAGCA